MFLSFFKKKSHFWCIFTDNFFGVYSPFFGVYSLINGLIQGVYSIIESSFFSVNLTSFLHR